MGKKWSRLLERLHFSILDGSGNRRDLILRPDVYQSFRVLGQRSFNVFLVKLFDGS
jgi:hypothetical protein